MSYIWCFCIPKSETNWTWTEVLLAKLSTKLHQDIPEPSWGDGAKGIDHACLTSFPGEWARGPERLSAQAPYSGFCIPRVDALTTYLQPQWRFTGFNVHFKSQMGDPLAVQWVRSHLQRRGHGFDPWSRKILPAAGHQSRRARTTAPALCVPRATATEARESRRATTEPVCCKDEPRTPKARAPQPDAAAAGSPAPRLRARLTAVRESPWQQQRLGTAKKKYLKEKRSNYTSVKKKKILSRVTKPPTSPLTSQGAPQMGISIHPCPGGGCSPPQEPPAAPRPARLMRLKLSSPPLSWVE